MAWAQENATNDFLAKNYGWVFGVKQEYKLFGWSWDLVCDPDRAVLPEKGKNVFLNWVCRQKDPSYFTVVLWRLSSVKPETIEKVIYNDMAGGFGYGKVECTVQEIDMANAQGQGIIKDCSVPLQNGTFFTSFFHFEAKVAPYTVEANGKVIMSDKLAFTIYVRNASPKGSDSRVKDKLRELVSSMKFVAESK